MDPAYEPAAWHEIAGAILVPGQPLALLGVELGIAVLASPVHRIRGVRHLPHGHRTGAGVELLIGLAGSSLGVLAGISLIVRWGGGLWLLLPVGAIALVSSVWNAWRLMVDVAAEGRAEA